MSTSTLSAVDANTGNKIALATFDDATGNTAVGHVVLAGTPLVPVAPANPLSVTDSATEAALITVGANTAGTLATTGTPTDAAWGGAGAGTLVALLKALYGELAGTLSTTITGTATVSGAGAVGAASVSPPISVSGVDAQGLKRPLLTDENGVIQVAQTAPLPPGTNVVGSVTVSGTPTVTVGNFPATQAVSGTVVANQGNAPWSVALAAGTAVGIAGTPAVVVSNFPAAQTVSGTVNVGNLPVTQAVSGTVTLGAGSQTIGTVGIAGIVAVADSTAAAALTTIATNTAVPAARVLISRSIPSTTASASTVLVAANAARRLLRIQAAQSAGVWLNLLGGLAGMNAPDCLYLAPGDVFESQDTNAVTYWCPTSGLVLSAWEA